MVDSEHARYIQLTHLPTLNEIDHDKTEAAVVKILGKAVALQLKPMNAEISKFAFEQLMLFVDDQLNDMITQLHRFSNVQRRDSIAKGDIQLFLEGYNLTPADLDQQHQASQYYGKIFEQEFRTLHTLKETFSDAVPEDDTASEEVTNQLVPPNNPLATFIPKWMPAFPPDHTYRFTPQYNHPITDETIIRRRIVEEGKQSEVALLHLLKSMNPQTPSADADGLSYDEALVKEETAAIYGNEQKKRKINASSTSDLLSKLPQTNFSVEEYARSRVELARRKVVEYEERQLEIQRNPFIKYSKLVLSTSADKPGRRQTTREINSMLQRSLHHLIKSIPELQVTKQEARRAAEQHRDERLQRLREQKAQQVKDLTDQQLENGDINLLDLDENNDDFFNYSGSDNEEDDLPPPSELATQPRLAEPEGMAPRLPTPAPDTAETAEPADPAEPASEADPQTQTQQPEHPEAQSEHTEAQPDQQAATEDPRLPEVAPTEQGPIIHEQEQESDADEESSNFLLDFTEPAEPAEQDEQDDIQL